MRCWLHLVYECVAWHEVVFADDADTSDGDIHGYSTRIVTANTSEEIGEFIVAS